MHVKEGRKNTTKVFSAVVADDTAVIRLVTFGLLNCQRAKNVMQVDSIVAATWNNATYDPQEPQYRLYQSENWQIRFEESTILQKLKSTSFKKVIPEFQKCKKERREAVFLESFDHLSDLKNNDRITFIAHIVGGVGMKHPQKNGDFFKVLLSNKKSQSMPVVYIFNHDDIRAILLQHVASLLKFENFRVSVHHGIKGIVSTDDSSVCSISASDYAGGLTHSTLRSLVMSSSSTNEDKTTFEGAHHSSSTSLEATEKSISNEQNPKDDDNQCV